MSPMGGTQIQDPTKATKINQIFEILQISIQYLVIFNIQRKNMRFTAFFYIFISIREDQLKILPSSQMHDEIQNLEEYSIVSENQRYIKFFFL